MTPRVIGAHAAAPAKRPLPKGGHPGRVLAGTIASGAVAAAGVLHRARHTWPYAPRLEQIDLAVPSRFPEWRPFRIGFVTDTHIGPVIRAADIDRALSLLRAADPDLLLLGGDYICESPRFAPEAAAVLGEHAAAVRFGALAVLGNHDYSCDAPRLVSLLEGRGIRVLRNESARVATRAGDLWVTGIDDAILASPDVPRAFAKIPDDGLKVAIWHEPDWASETARFGPLLQLSGHSHGGQVRLPLVGDIAAPRGGRRYVAGWHDAGGMPVYTSRGLGVYRPPIRFRCSPEVTLVTLQPAPRHCLVSETRGCHAPPGTGGT